MEIMVGMASRMISLRTGSGVMVRSFRACLSLAFWFCIQNPFWRKGK